VHRLVGCPRKKARGVLTKLHRRVTFTMKNSVVKQCKEEQIIFQSVLEHFDSTLWEIFVSSYLGTLSMKPSCENLRLELKKMLIKLVFQAKIKILWTY